MAAIEQPAQQVAAWQIKAPKRDAVRSCQDWSELELMKDAEEGRLPVVRAEAAEESRVGEEASPALADGRGAREGGWLGREAEEDLPEHVVVFKRGTTAAADHGGALLTGVCRSGDGISSVDLWMHVAERWLFES